MAVRTSNKKKDPPVLSHEFVRKNYGDIMCIAFMAMFGGSMLNFTAKYTNHLSRFSYRSTPGEGQPTLYGNGFADLIVVFTYSLLCTVATCLVNENVCDKFIPRLHLSHKKAFELRYTITYSLFYLFTTSIFALIWTGAAKNDEAFSVKAHLASLANNQPEIFVGLYVKVFYTIALSFCVAMLMNIYFLNIKSKQYATVIFDNVAAFAIYYAMQFFNCGTLGVYLVTAFAVPKLFWSLKYVSDEFAGKKSYPIRLAFSLLHLVAAVAGLCSSWLYASFLARTTDFSNLLDNKTVSRTACIAFVFVSSIVTLSNLKETCSVVFKSATPEKGPKSHAAKKATSNAEPKSAHKRNPQKIKK